jgi:predicted PurR-regulated permease PerM
MPMTPRQTAVNTVVILLVVLVAWLLVQVRSTIVLLIVGILFAAAIEPLVNRMRRRGLKRGQAILAIYGALLVALILSLLLVVPSLVRQSTSLVDNIPETLASSRERFATRCCGESMKLRTSTNVPATSPRPDLPAMPRSR